MVLHIDTSSSRAAVSSGRTGEEAFCCCWSIRNGVVATDQTMRSIASTFIFTGPDGEGISPTSPSSLPSRPLASGAR